MFDGRIVIAAMQVRSSDRQLNGFLGFTYTREGSSVMPRGVAMHYLDTNFTSSAISLANQRLLVGVPCTSGFPGCWGGGKADLCNLNTFLAR